MLYFVSSIGRSGTRYLANLISACSSIPAFHLKEPYCHSSIYQEANTGQLPPEIIQKADDIETIVTQHGSYFESTPVFIRGLAPYFLQRFSSISVIHLLRDPLQVARSYTNRDSHPSHPNRPWRLPLSLSSSLLPAPAQLTPYQENLWDWIENELRFHHLKHRFVQAQVLYFDDFSVPSRIIEVFTLLGIPIDAEKIRVHTTQRDLDRNPNKLPTEITSQDQEEASALIPLLSATQADFSPFRLQAYDPFPFIRTLVPFP